MSFVENTLKVLKSHNVFEILGLLTFIFIAFKVFSFAEASLVYYFNEKSAQKIHVEMKPNELQDILTGRSLATITKQL